MKTKQKHIVRGILMLRIKNQFKYQAVLVLLFVALFVFNEKAIAASGGVIINETQVAGITANDEFIELYNDTSESVDISTWSIQYRGGTGASYYKKNFEKNNIIPAKGYFLIAHGGSGNYSGVVPYDMSWSQSLSSTGGAILLVNNQILLTAEIKTSIVDKVGYGVTADSEVLPAIKPGANQSIQRKKFQDTDNNNDDFEIAISPSPTASGCLENSEKCKIEENKKEEIVEKKTYPTGISITELFPNPFESQYEEYVELYNGTLEDVDLLGWTLHDASKSGKYTFAQSVILKAQKYLAVFKKDFKFALNNSGNESVTLLDPNGIEISKASYDGSKKNVSYNFDGSRWRWSKFLTPGAENILNNEPSGTVKIDDEIFANAYANFSVSTGDVDGDKVKVTWDFGDGHKSYLSKTRHKYESVGTYNGNVKLSDGSEEVVKTFVAEVKKFPHPKVKIISINANPVGSDTLGESLVIENKSKKKIDLLGWRIATGSKTLANHPIIEKFILKKKQSREITREISKFTLNNKKGKIELRYPDGEVADKIKYDHGKISIEEGEKYVKSKSGWSWVATSQKSIKSVKSIKQEDLNILPSVISNQSSNSEDENGEVAGVEVIKREYSYVMVENSIVIGKIEFKNSDSRVAGVESVREADGKYLLTSPGREQEHYALVFFKDIYSNINTRLNLLLNFFISKLW